MDNYVIEFDDIKDKKLDEVYDIIYNTQGIDLNRLKVMDLIFQNKKPIIPGQGVYIFRDKYDYNLFIYVGKVSSMSFTERIGKHFDLREHAWFNTLMKTIKKNNSINDMSDNIFKTIYNGTANYAFENLNLVLINFKWVHRDKINRTESLFRASSNTLNGLKRKRIKKSDFQHITLNQY